MTNQWRAAMLLAALVGARQLVGAAQPQASAPPLNLEERVAAVVKSEMLARGIPSVSVAVMRDGKMVLERAWGVADLEKNVSASAATTYPIGSVTKQFTAALLSLGADGICRSAGVAGTEGATAAACCRTLPTLENGELYVTPRGGGTQPLVFRSGNSYMRDADIITFVIENGVVTGFEANANGNKRMLKKVK